MAVGLSLAICLAIDVWLVPQVMHQRVVTTEALIHSHQQALAYKDHRALRDELLARGILSDDRDFDQYWLANSENSIRSTLKTCHFITDSTCVNSSDALFFNYPARDGLQAVSYAIHLKTDYFGHVTGVPIWKLAAIALIAAILALVIVAIRRQEQFLVDKIGLLLSTISTVEGLFQVNESLDPSVASGNDEFRWMSESIEKAAETLRARSTQIEEYRKAFAKRAQMEQLAATIGGTSHNLLAPMLETKVFLQKLPNYLETMPREKLLESTASLEKRVSQGAETLRAALQATKETFSTIEPLDVRESLNQFKQAVAVGPSFRGIQLTIDTDRWASNARVPIKSSDFDSILWNLTKNALDAKHNANITIRAFTQAEEAVLQFQDDGPGIPETLREKIFEGFFTTKLSGTGIGLASSRRLIEKSHGTIQALPTEQGAHFEIRLPLLGPSHGGTAHA
jgi:signal transduction histidine kinase